VLLNTCFWLMISMRVWLILVYLGSIALFAFRHCMGLHGVCSGDTLIQTGNVIHSRHALLRCTFMRMLPREWWSALQIMRQHCVVMSKFPVAPTVKRYGVMNLVSLSEIGSSMHSTTTPDFEYGQETRRYTKDPLILPHQPTRRPHRATSRSPLQTQTWADC